jgi:hypothetical protein
MFVVTVFKPVFVKLTLKITLCTLVSLGNYVLCIIIVGCNFFLEDRFINTITKAIFAIGDCGMFYSVFDLFYALIVLDYTSSNLVGLAGTHFFFQIAYEQ